MRQSSTWYHQPWQLVVDLSGSSWSICLFYQWSYNGTSCDTGLGEVQPTRSTSFPAWKSCVSSLILVIRPRSCFTWATTFEAMLFRSYDDVVFCILHDATDDNMWGSCISCRQHLWRKLIRTFLNGKDSCDECGSPIFRQCCYWMRSWWSRS